VSRNGGDGRTDRRSSGWRVVFVLAATLAVLLSSQRAEAQQKTMYLDRLAIGGAPDDGIAIWRPYVHPRTRFFAQMALGFALNPLRLGTVAPTTSTGLGNYPGNPVSSQIIDYATGGVELANRATMLVTLPIALYQSGTDPTRAGVRGVGSIRSLTLLDMRLDGRAVFYRSDDQRLAFAAGISVYLPTGGQFSYAGDGGTHASFNVAMETYVRDIIVAVNTGLHLRPAGVVGELAVGNEWTLGAGAFLPLRDNTVRVGFQMYMSTGLESLAGQSQVSKSTFLSTRNTPLEWLAEGRMALDPTRQLWVGGGLGTRLDSGYGAPDLRLIATIGYAAPIQDSDVTAPDRRMRFIRDRIAREGGDADHDGVPDDVDLCPTEPEDKQEPDATDGCPKPEDKDGDGIPDAADRCPDAVEDKDGIQDMDGCPETDFDNDAIPDVSDACPREPGSPSTNPKLNGCPQFIKRVSGSTEIQILKQVQFDTGRATIKATSYGILDEIVQLMRANPDITKLSIEGHTDDRGSVDLNNRLSQERSEAVLHYLSAHGIASSRLEAHGFGPSRPLESNDAESGRQKNRRVEFHIQQ
jgi:OOP family OmpA-OmpF porin